MNQKCPRVLFILKRHECYGSGLDRSSGLQNSAEFVSEMLVAAGLESKTVTVVDNNDVDREVSRYRPDVAMIEALWIVPEKFDVLKRLHPNVKWVVRVHSKLPFLAHEGCALGWLRGYGSRGVVIAPNSDVMCRDLAGLNLQPVYLPNCYPDRFLSVKKAGSCRGELHVGCFGAIRPMKNHLLQAVAAVEFADLNGSRLWFHVNVSRLENGGANVAKNLRALFSVGRHQLVEHDWEEHEKFLGLLDEMDAVMSVSFSETFSIVTADAVSRQVPVVTSPEIDWTDPRVQADPTNVQDVIAKMTVALNKAERIGKSNVKRLQAFSARARSAWLAYLTGEKQTTWRERFFNASL